MPAAIEDNTMKEIDEKLLTKSLIKTMQKHNLYEASEGETRRQHVLHQLEEVLSKWSRSLWKSKNNSSSNAAKARNVTLITFGSYRLRVHKSSSDIDVLALCPHHITRDDFFDSLVSTLDADARVTDLHPIPGAYTPVMKFYFDRVAIDLLFAQVGEHHAMPLRPRKEGGDTKGVWQEAELDDAHLIGLDECALRSLNGVRVAQLLLKLVKSAGAAGCKHDDCPEEQCNRTFENFRTALITIKEWANTHGLYSNVLGFLGGVNWAILVAKVVQIKPNATPPALIRLFFRMFARWRWPKPVRLLNMQKTSPHPSVEFPCWNNRLNHRDGKDLMPIITPAYPSMNSSYNVQRPQLRRIKDEIDKAEVILDAIYAGSSTWDDLFTNTPQPTANVTNLQIMEHNFFWQHVHYLEITIRATNANDFRSWFGYCESRLRVLINSFESHPDMMGVLECFPYAKFFERVVENKGKHGKTFVTSFFMALRFARGVEEVDLTPCPRKYLTDVNSWPERVPGMDVSIEHKLQKHLPSFVFAAAEVPATTRTNTKKVIDTSGKHEKEGGNGQKRFSSTHKGKGKRKKMPKNNHSEKWQNHSSKRPRKELSYGDTVDEV